MFNTHNNIRHTQPLTSPTNREPRPKHFIFPLYFDTNIGWHTPPTDRAPRQKHFTSSLHFDAAFNILAPTLDTHHHSSDRTSKQKHCTFNTNFQHTHTNIRHTSPLTPTNRAPRQKHFILSLYININFQHTYTYIGHTPPHTLLTDTQSINTHPLHSHTPILPQSHTHIP